MLKAIAQIIIVFTITIVVGNQLKSIDVYAQDYQKARSEFIVRQKHPNLLTKPNE